MQSQSKIFVFVLAIALVFTFACGKVKPEESSTPQQLTKEDHSCKNWDDATINTMKAKFPANFIRSFQGEELNHAYQALAGIPPAYIDWLISVDGFYITKGNIGFPGGLTEMGDTEPSWIKIQGGARVIDLSLQHETGHALSPYFWKKILTSKSQFDSVFGKIARDSFNNPNLNAYPKSYGKNSETYVLEYYAEAFNTYYCSPETNTMLKDQFPDTYKFFAEKAEKPVWESTTPSLPIAPDVFIALSDKQVIYISFPSGKSTNFDICEKAPTAQGCAVSDPGYSRMKFSHKIGTRDFYVSDKEFYLHESMNLLLTVNDSVGKPIAKRAVIIQQK